MRRKEPRQRGFTLSEVMAGIGVLSLVGTALTSVLIGTINSFGYQSRMLDAQTDVASAMALVQDDLRAAGYVVDTMNQAIFQQVTSGTSSDSIEFVGDVNADDVSERITYNVSGGKLMRTQDTWNGTGWTSGTAQPVAANITIFTLKFYIVSCAGTISQQAASDVTGSNQTSIISITLSGTGTYKGQTITKTLTSDVAERQQNVVPSC